MAASLTFVKAWLLIILEAFCEAEEPPLRIAHSDCFPEVAWSKNGPNGSMVYEGSSVFTFTDVMRLAGIDQSEVAMVWYQNTTRLSNTQYHHMTMVRDGMADLSMFGFPFDRSLIESFDFSPWIVGDENTRVTKSNSEARL